MGNVPVFLLAVDIVLKNVEVLRADCLVLSDVVGAGAEVSGAGYDRIDGADVAFDGQRHQGLDEGLLFGDATFAAVLANNDEFAKLRRKISFEIGDVFLAPLRVSALPGFELAAFGRTLVADRILLMRHDRP